MEKTTPILLLCAAAVVGIVVFLKPLPTTATPYLVSYAQRLFAAKDEMPGANSGGHSKTDASGIHTNSKNGNVAIPVRVAATQSSTVPLVVRTFGIIQSRAVVSVNARIASQILEIHVKDGQTVKSGDLLVTLDGQLLQGALSKDQAVLVKDKANAVNAEVEMSRAKTLLTKGAGTQEAYDAALAAQKAAEAVVAADQAVVDSDTSQLDYARITAPIDGRLGAIQVAVGDLVGNGSSNGQQAGLMTITQMQPLKIAFRLPEGELPDIRKTLDSGGQVSVRVLNNGTPDVLDSGNLNFIDSSVDATSGTIAMSATLPNSKLRLWPGQYVNVEIEYGQLASAIVIPSVAIQQGQKGAFVWLVKDDNTVEAKLVEVTHFDDVNAAIASGLSIGDKVVVEGQLRLKNGAAIKLNDTAGA